MNSSNYCYAICLYFLVLFCGLSSSNAFAVLDNTVLPDSNFGISQSNDYAPPDPEDDSKLSWTEAFDNMCTKMAKEFSYTDRLKIDWKNLHDTYRPLIAEAEQQNDLAKYYDLLREFVASLHENHTRVVVSKQDNSTSFNVAIAEVINHIGGWYGVVLTKTSDDSYIVSYAAPQTGIKLGAKIITWNGKSIAEAVNNTPLTWEGGQGMFQKTLQNGTAVTNLVTGTKDAMRYERLRLLVRASIGSQVQITYQNEHSSLTETTTLTAIDDNFAYYDATQIFHDPNIDNPDMWLWSKILDDNIGYIRIVEEGDIDSNLAKFRNIINEYNTQNVKAIILDIRGNVGGDDGLSFDIVSSFTDHFFPTIDTLAFNKLTDDFYDFGTNILHPKRPGYNGAVVVLTDAGTLCAGEGLASGMKGLSNVYLMSFDEGTRGSYTMPNYVTMPGNFVVYYAIRRILNGNHEVTIEADNNGGGGVKPDIVIPMTTEYAKHFFDQQIYGTGNDLALDYAEEWIKKNVFKEEPDDNGNEFAGSKNHSSSNNLGGIIAATAIGAGAIVSTLPFLD